jgi:hypothetical protein
MKIVHSKIEKPEVQFVPRTPQEQFDYEMALANHKRVLKRNAERLKEIQQVYPGWLPEFRYGNFK